MRFAARDGLGQDERRADQLFYLDQKRSESRTCSHFITHSHTRAVLPFVNGWTGTRQVKATAVLKHLASDEEIRNEIVSSSDSVGPLVAALRDGEGEVTPEMFEAMENLMQNASARSQMAAANAEPLLTDILLTESGYEKTKSSAILRALLADERVKHYIVTEERWPFVLELESELAQIQDR